MPRGVAEGFFEGQCAGPQASELLIRWLLPQSGPEVGATGSLFGVLGGRRQSDQVRATRPQTSTALDANGSRVPCLTSPEHCVFPMERSCT